MLVEGIFFLFKMKTLCKAGEISVCFINVGFLSVPCGSHLNICYCVFYAWPIINLKKLCKLMRSKEEICKEVGVILCNLTVLYSER